MKQVEIYTDGGCNPNPGLGTYCAIIIYNNVKKIIAKRENNTTNNRMELKAAIEGILALKEPCHIKLYSDSQYLVNAMSKGWAINWKRNNWKRKGDKIALNSDLFEILLNLCSIHDITFIWVKGHSNNIYNCKCDEICNVLRDKNMPPVYEYVGP